MQGKSKKNVHIFPGDDVYTNRNILLTYAGTLPGTHPSATHGEPTPNPPPIHPPIHAIIHPTHAITHPIRAVIHPTHPIATPYHAACGVASITCGAGGCLGFRPARGGAVFNGGAGLRMKKGRASLLTLSFTGVQ